MEPNETATAETTENTQDTQTTDTTATASESTETAATSAPEETEEISYHTVEQDGNVTAIWEMQGQKHLRTIDPRSAEGKNILSLFETAA